MRYNVHLYTTYRVKFANVEADSPEEAVRAALKLPHTAAVEIEDAEDLPQEALVDVVGDEDFLESRNFAIRS